METSLFLAKLIAPILLLIGLGILINRDWYRGMAREFLASKALVYLAGLLALASGLAILLVHNRWEAGWPIIVTLFGWLMLIGGVARIVLPDRTEALRQRIVESETTWPIAGGIYLVLGLLLGYFGYVAQGS